MQAEHTVKYFGSLKNHKNMLELQYVEHSQVYSQYIQ